MANGEINLREEKLDPRANPHNLKIGDLVEICGAPRNHELGIIVLMEHYPSNVYEKAFTSCSVCWTPDSHETIIDARVLKRVSI